ncbi:MAG: universal stress protein [Deltaproteobacteria bacterium]|nr:universal stress protein [Candidatus Anaeroferrophillus wilburensis]MBN2889784.1 universal stress protein [Deltaproteobacteria bacterium]
MLIKKVLTLTDGSELSRSALRYAVEICRQFDATLYLLTVVDKVPSYIDAEISHEIYEKMEDVLRSEVANCSGYCETSGLGCKAEVRHGIPYEEIISYAEEIDADLIVLATHGHSGIAHVLLGSVAEKVVRHAPCPVLTVRPKGKDWEISKPGSCEV